MVQWVPPSWQGPPFPCNITRPCENPAYHKRPPHTPPPPCNITREILPPLSHHTGKTAATAPPRIKRSARQIDKLLLAELTDDQEDNVMLTKFLFKCAPAPLPARLGVSWRLPWRRKEQREQRSETDQSGQFQLRLRTRLSISVVTLKFYN